MSDKLTTLKHLDGKRFCLVCMTVLDAATQKVKLAPIHGTARIQANQMMVVEPSGRQHTIPESALESILPSDGTEILKDAEHYVIVKIGTLNQNG